MPGFHPADLAKGDVALGRLDCRLDAERCMRLGRHAIGVSCLLNVECTVEEGVGHREPS